MAILRKIVILVLPLLLAGCYEDFVPDIDVKPVLCINSLITAGEKIDVKVSRTWFYASSTPGLDTSVPDARVSVYVNGNTVGSDYVAAEGDHVRIVAESPAYGVAEAEVDVPRAPAARLLRWAPTDIDAVNNDSDTLAMDCLVRFAIKAELEVTDDPAAADFYSFAYSIYDCEGVHIKDNVWATYYPGLFWINNVDFSAEPIFGEHIGVIESVMGAEAYGFTFFTDRQFSGASYTLHLSFTDCWYTVRNAEWDPALLDCGLILTLYAVSPSYYNLANYMWQADESMNGGLSDIGLADPIPGYSNVSTGAGVVAARTSARTLIPLAPLLTPIVE